MEFNTHLAWLTPRTGPVVVGIAGGSGSGKSVIAHAIEDALSPHACLIAHDRYYRSLAHLPTHHRHTINFDHPDALETTLLVKHLNELRRGNPIQQPNYDFNTHTRLPSSTWTQPSAIIIIEGILVLHEKTLRAQMDLCVYVDTPSDVRLARRIKRDKISRGRDDTQTIEQYLETVLPMHTQYVEPSRAHADLVIPGGYRTGAVGTLIAALGALSSPSS